MKIIPGLIRYKVLSSHGVTICNVAPNSRGLSQINRVYQ